MMLSKEQNASPPNTSFLFEKISLSYFDAPYHSHSEYELTLILKSEGKRFVGSHVANFSEGDLVLVGPNVPHCWKNDGMGFENSSQAIVIQFKPSFLGYDFLGLPELQPVRLLLEKAKTGIQIHSSIRQRVAKEIIFLTNVPPIQKLLGLIDILNTIATSGEYTAIESQLTIQELPKADLDKITKIYAYVVSNYTQEVHLDTVAYLANMTETAFCRYFKRITGKTFLDLVTEFRISHACDLLINSDKQVAEVCFESGFGNISHFNKQFKTVTGYSPLHYKKKQLNYSSTV